MILCMVYVWFVYVCFKHGSIRANEKWTNMYGLSNFKYGLYLVIWSIEEESPPKLASYGIAMTTPVNTTMNKTEITKTVSFPPQFGLSCLLLPNSRTTKVKPHEKH